MSHVLEAILQRRAIKVFDPVEIPAETREQILHAARVATPRQIGLMDFVKRF